MSATVRFPARDEFRDDRAPEWARRYRGGDYPYVGLAADLVALCLSADAARLDVLTITRAAAPFAGRQALPGGFLDWLADHDIEDTARREAREETGVEAPAFLEKLEAKRIPA